MKQTSKTTFEPDWLALREPADHAARDSELLHRAAALAGSGATVLDLGSGTGSTARAFALTGHEDLHWCFFDNDPALLQVANNQHPTANCVVGSVTDVGTLPLDGVGLVTASALLDLMTLEWLTAMAERLAAARIPLYAALSYDGKMHWDPAHEADEVITAAFNRHQKSDKGIGASLGPDSGTAAKRVFTAHGFDVEMRSSPWVIGPDQAALHDALLAGIGSAADEAGEPSAAEWTAARRATTGTSTSTVGHIDCLMVPTGQTGGGR